MRLNHADFNAEDLAGKTIKSAKVLQESKIGEGDGDEQGYFEQLLKVTCTDGTEVFLYAYKDST